MGKKKKPDDAPSSAPDDTPPLHPPESDERAATLPRVRDWPEPEPEPEAAPVALKPGDEVRNRYVGLEQGTRVAVAVDGTHGDRVRTRTMALDDDEVFG